MPPKNTDPEVDESEYEMVSTGTRFGAAPKLAREWVGVPEVILESGKKASFWASQLTAEDLSQMMRQRRQYDRDGRYTGLDDTHDLQRRLAWALRDGQGRRCWADTDTALTHINAWPVHVVDRLTSVLDGLSVRSVDEPGKDSGTTRTGS